MLKQHSTGLIATVSDPGLAREFEKSLTIGKILDTAVPMSVVSQNVNPGDLERSLDIHLTRMVESLNLKWNISPAQIKIIVEDLIDKYKHETLEDFILIFKKARQGEFGEIYRLDSAVIFGWVEKYLEEKYEAIERKLTKEKDNQYSNVKQSPPVPKSFKLVYDVPWVNAPVKKKAARAALWRFQFAQMGLMRDRKPAPLTDKDVLKEGQLKPEFKPYPYTNAEVYQKHLDQRTRKGRELWFRENYPNASEADINNYLNSFEV